MSASQKPDGDGVLDPVDGSADISPEPYPAGSPVALTGIYTLQHACSRPAQDMVAVRGRRFLACPDCAGGYVLKCAAPLPDEDPDFQASPA